MTWHQKVAHPSQGQSFSTSRRHDLHVRGKGVRFARVQLLSLEVGCQRPSPVGVVLQGDILGDEFKSARRLTL
jgi:hypothetical protein